MSQDEADRIAADWPTGGEHLAAALAAGTLDDVLPPYLGLAADGTLIYTSPAATEFLVFPTGRQGWHIDAVIAPWLAETVAALRTEPLAAGELQVKWQRDDTCQIAVRRLGLDDGRELLLFLPASQSERVTARSRVETDDQTRMADAAQVAVVFLTPQLNLRRFTPAAQAMFQCRDIDVGRPIVEVSASIDVQRLALIAKSVVETGQSHEEDFVTREDGPVYALRFCPYGQAGSQEGGIVIAMSDVTEGRFLAGEVDRIAEQSRQRLTEIEQLYDVTPQAMGLIAPDLTYQRVNQRLAAINGVSVAAHIGRRMDEIVPVLSEQVTAAAQQVFETGERLENLRVTGRTAQRPSEDRVWETDWYPVRNAAKTIISVGVNVRDITEQVQMGEELRRVMQELQHRVQNMLANVNALVSRMGRDATEGRALFDELSSRIKALSKTHKLLTDAHWNAVPLMELLQPELPEVYGPDRVSLTGPGIEISARAAPPLAMAIHELATNAAKYGAFSVPDGIVDLSWERRDDGVLDRYIFVWRETGGPPPAEARVKGFGSELIASTIQHSLEGVVTTQWGREGLVCTLAIPTTVLRDHPEHGPFQVF